MVCRSVATLGPVSEPSNPGNGPTFPQLLDASWRRWLFLAAFVAAVPVPIIFIAIGREQGAWIAVLAGVVGMLLTRLDDVESFALGPLKAQMRKEIERAKDATERANATVEQLRRLALALAGPTLSTTLVTPRFSAGPSPDQYAARDQIVAELRALGVPERDIDRALVRWNRGAEMDHQDAIYSAARAVFADDPTAVTKLASLGEHVNNTRLRLSRGEAVPAEEFFKLVREVGLDVPGVTEAIADLAHFQKHRALRRPDVFPGR